MADIPKYKIAFTNIGVVYKSTDGWCYFLEKIFFHRNYLGAGTYGNVELFFAEGIHEAIKIDCSKVK